MPAGDGSVGNGSAARKGKAGKRKPEIFDTERFLTSTGIGRTIATYKPRSYIFRQGHKCAAVYYIQEGRVELTVVSKQGKERVVGLLGPGDFVGEGSWAASSSIRARSASPACSSCCRKSARRRNCGRSLHRSARR